MAKGLVMSSIAVSIGKLDRTTTSENSIISQIKQISKD
jgi:hypothetical protein